jgi:hypothetical protein
MRHFGLVKPLYLLTYMRMKLNQSFILELFGILSFYYRNGCHIQVIFLCFKLTF